MQTQATILAALSQIDEKLDELQEDLGDLPVQVKKMEKAVRERAALVDETKKLLDEVKGFRANSSQSILSLNDKEKKLTEQQTGVRNNREFDAIASEIGMSKEERTKLDEGIRTAGVKEENLAAILEQQQENLKEAKKDLKDKEKELLNMTGDQMQEVKELEKQRLEMIGKLQEAIAADYERIRTFHKDAAVSLRRNSCAGCFSAVPSQKAVEMRNAPDRAFTCEACGRILYPEELKPVENAEA
ncbi:MAG: C4-type zinc ribbon domain-containing protein [Bacteroidota bacterium]